MWQLTLGYGSLEFPKRTSKVQINLKQQTLQAFTVPSKFPQATKGSNSSMCKLNSQFVQVWPSNYEAVPKGVGCWVQLWSHLSTLEFRAKVLWILLSVQSVITICFFLSSPHVHNICSVFGKSLYNPFPKKGFWNISSIV